MRKSIIKIIMLAMLSVLCVWQMVTLWLGDMSGHNFLGKNPGIYNRILVQPKTMWMNTGKLAYKIEENKREYSILIEEFTSLIASHKKNIKVEEEKTRTYEELLSRQGILYEYDLGITLQELVGSSMDRVQEGLIIDQVFVDMSAYNEHITNLYFVGNHLKSIHKIIIYNRLSNHQKLVERFNNPEFTRGLIGYQPSITSNKKTNIKDNMFLPLNTSDNPIVYEVLYVSNPIEKAVGQEKMDVLESYVNSFFANPLLKQIDLREDGSVIFSESIGAVVKYEPVGTLEFNITSVREGPKLTSIERLMKVMNFIESSRGIPEFLKEGIYLSEVVSQGEEVIYRFNYKYKGFGIHLTKKVKERLGLDNILEITIKNNQVSRGKWSILEIESYGKTGGVPRGFDEIIDGMYEQHIGYKHEKLDLVQCRYIMNELEGKLGFNWIVQYQGRWYYP